MSKYHEDRIDKYRFPYNTLYNRRAELKTNLAQAVSELNDNKNHLESFQLAEIERDIAKLNEQISQYTAVLEMIEDA